MGKTYYRKKSVLKHIENETIEQAFDIETRFSRHPKSHKNSGLKKEFKLIPEKFNMRVWKDRFGERDEKSDRLKRIRKIGSKSRRKYLKNVITKNIIDEEIS